MEIENKGTAPKPFIFVLMPFDQKYDDIYKFGIKGAAEDVGAYAERIDDQIFTEGILDRVFNQINKADVIVADMTERNANVFYEVGYAHALGKMVLLLTQDSNDIPFDLKHHQHTVYSGKIDVLRTDLSKKLLWAIKESNKQALNDLNEKYEISINDIFVPESALNQDVPTITLLADDSSNQLDIIVRNSSLEMSPRISHIYLFTKSQTILTIFEFRDSYRYLEYAKAHPSDAIDGLDRQYRIGSHIQSLPPSASDTFTLGVSASPENLEGRDLVEETLRLRFHSDNRIHDFVFKASIQKGESNPAS